MTGSKVVQRLCTHLMWVNRNLLAAAGTLSDAQLRQQFAIGQGSVWQSLTHMYAAEFVWLAALNGNESAIAPGDVGGKLPGNQLGPDPANSLAELRTRWEDLMSRWNEWIGVLTDAGLDEQISRVSSSTSAGKTFVHSKGDVVMHVCLHAHYTAAQVVNMFRQLGAPLPDTMLIMLSRLEQS